MQKVIHASLHGNAWAIEEAGYEALRAYLDRAAQQLAADPDRDEIVGDLEQAIADKCARFRSPHKSVITADEMARVLAEMGPVGSPEQVGPGAPAGTSPDGIGGTSTGTAPETGPAAPGEPAAAAAAAASAASPPPRRLYRVLEGGWLGGLCNGVGAYLGVDPTLVRVIFVVLALVTHGAWLLVYAVLMFVIPAAGTPEERAAARGLPFSAQALIDEAKRHYATLERELAGPWEKVKRSWKREWRRETRANVRAEREAHKAWRAEYRAERRAERRAVREEAAAVAAAHASTYAQQVAAGVALPILSLLSAALTVAWLVATAMLLVSGSILGWSPGLPLWASLLIVLLAASVVGQPLRAVRGALHRAPPGGHWHLLAWDGLLWLGFAALLAWQAWVHVPELRQLAHEAPAAVERVRASWQPKAP